MNSIEFHSFWSHEHILLQAWLECKKLCDRLKRMTVWYGHWYLAYTCTYTDATEWYRGWSVAIWDLTWESKVHNKLESMSWLHIPHMCKTAIRFTCQVSLKHVDPWQKMTLRLLPKALWENVKMICLAALRWKLLNVSWQGHMEANICKHHMQSTYNETWGRTCALPSCMTQGSAKMVAPSLEVDVPSLNHHMCNCNSFDFSLLQKIVVQRRNLSPLAKLLDEHLLNSTNYIKNQFGFMGWAISCHVDGQANIGDFNSILLPLALMRPWYSSYLGSAHVGSSALSKESKITFSLVMTRGTRPSNTHNKIWAANGVQVVGDTKDGTNTQSVCDQQAMSHPPDLVVYNWSIHPCWRMIGGSYCGLSVGQTEQKNQQSRTKHWQAPGTNWPHMATGCGFDRFLRNANFIDPPWGTANTLRWRTDPPKSFALPNWVAARWPLLPGSSRKLLIRDYLATSLPWPRPRKGRQMNRQMHNGRKQWKQMKAACCNKRSWYKTFSLVLEGWNQHPWECWQEFTQLSSCSFRNAQVAACRMSEKSIL